MRRAGVEILIRTAHVRTAVELVVGGDKMVFFLKKYLFSCVVDEREKGDVATSVSGRVFWS